MNTSSHYPSLELCKKLTEAGFPDETACHFRKSNSDIYEHTFGPWDDESYVCPSVMELLDEMPHYITTDQNEYELNIRMNGDSILVMYVAGMGMVSHFYGTLPNALAEMWLWLKENNYLTK